MLKEVCGVLDSIFYLGISVAGIVLVMYSAFTLDARCFELGVLALCLQHLYAIYRRMKANDVRRQRYEKLANLVCSMLDDYVEHGYDSSCLYPRIDDFEEFFDRSWQHTREKK